jgi:3-methyladenine DNA glycosylase AlkD
LAGVFCTDGKNPGTEGDATRPVDSVTTEAFYQKCVIIQEERPKKRIKQENMSQTAMENEAEKTAAGIEAEIMQLPVRNTTAMRAVRCRYSQTLRAAPARLIYQLAMELRKIESYRWIAYELIRGHRAAFESLGPAELEELGQGINSWWTVDAFARTLSGPAWLHRQVPDELMLKWAGSSDRWWRRAALVSTVALNLRSQGGLGDVQRTLPICRLLAGDRDDMVAKALSWALRELVVHDPGAVKEFLDEHDGVIPALVKREVKNKLRTGLKNPRRIKS